MSAAPDLVARLAEVEAEVERWKSLFMDAQDAADRHRADRDQWRALANAYYGQNGWQGRDIEHRRAEAAEARLAALRQAVESLAEMFAARAEVFTDYLTGGSEIGDTYAIAERHVRAVLAGTGAQAEHATPSDDTAAMWIDPNPPGVTPLPPEQAREILDALDGAPSDPPQDDDEAWNRADVHGCIVEDEDTGRCLMCRECAAPASADTEGVRLTDSECRRIVHASIARDRVFNGQDGDENAPADVLLTTVREILAARLRAATEGKGEAR